MAPAACLRFYQLINHLEYPRIVDGAVTHSGIPPKNLDSSERGLQQVGKRRVAAPLRPLSPNWLLDGSQSAHAGCAPVALTFGAIHEPFRPLPASLTFGNVSTVRMACRFYRFECLDQLLAHGRWSLTAELKLIGLP